MLQDQKFIDLREKIRYGNVVENNYTNVIILCEVYLKKLKSVIDTINKEEDLCFVYNTLAIAYKKLRDINNTIKYISLSNSYATSYREVARNNWLMGNCYLENKNISKALECFKLCSQIFKQTKDYLNRISILFTMAEIKHKTSTMFKIANKIDKETTDNYTINLLLQMYSTLVKQDKKYLNLIKNEYVREQLNKSNGISA